MPEPSRRFDESVAVPPVLSKLRTVPVTVVVAIAAVLAIVTARMMHSEPDFPHHPPVACAALVAVVASTWIAERALGSVRTVLVGVVAPVLAVLATLLAVTIGSALGEAHAETADGQPLFAPSTVAVALLGAASATMPLQWRWRVRTVLWTVVLTLVLFAGHGSDLARALATLLGTAAGAVVAHRASRPTERAARALPPTRTLVVAVLCALGAGTLVTLVVPQADGVLSPFADAMSDRSVAAVGVLLVLAGWLVQHGRRLGVTLAVGVLVTLTVVLADAFLIEPVQTGGVQWQGLGLDALEWQVTLLGAWLVPAAVLAVVVGLHGRLVRARFRAVEGSQTALVEMLRGGDAGSLGHMGTWHGNATWVHPGGLGAVAYRVRGEVALTVSDPVCAAADRPAVLAAFAASCERNGWVPAFTSVHDPCGRSSRPTAGRPSPSGSRRCSTSPGSAWAARSGRTSGRRRTAPTARASATSGRPSPHCRRCTGARSRRSAPGGRRTGVCPRWASRSVGSGSWTTRTSGSCSRSTPRTTWSG